MLAHGSKREITICAPRFAASMVIAALMLIALPDGASARCGDDPGDVEAMAAVRADVNLQCPCAGVERRGDYLRCVREVIKIAVDTGALPKMCASQVRRCSTKSSCGRPGKVSCCRTNRRGVTRCSIKSSAARCKAPSGGSACVSGWSSCCDACSSGGCIRTPTPTPTLTPTLTPTPTIPPFCQSQVPLPELAQIPFTVEQGTAFCGGLGSADPPTSGSVTDADGNTLRELGLGCLYTGNLSGSMVPDGSTTMLGVTGINGLTITLGGSDGSGPRDCTKGAGPDLVCLNGAPGTDGNGACTNDSDCGGQFACQFRPNCFFGPPVPIPQGSFSACVVNTFLTDLCGSIDLQSGNTTAATALLAIIYLTGDADEPCPICSGGACSAGVNEGQVCTPTGTLMTSPDCPPATDRFIGVLRVILPELTTGTVQLDADENGLFCPGQQSPGALGQTSARTITQSGIPLGSGSSPSSTGLAGVFCIPATGSLLDLAGGFPTAGAFSQAGSLDLSAVLGGGLLGGLEDLEDLPVLGPIVAGLSGG